MTTTERETEMTTETIETTCPACEWAGYEHRHNDAEDGPRSECCEHNHE